MKAPEGDTLEKKGASMKLGTRLLWTLVFCTPLSCGDDSGGTVTFDARPMIAIDASISAFDALVATLPESATVTTLATFPFQTEGLTGDGNGNFYTAARNAGVSMPCAVYRVKMSAPTPAIVGYLPTPSATTQCSTSGLAFNSAGDLFVAASLNAGGEQNGWVYKLAPNETTPPTATVFVSDVPLANGIAFDKAGNLWVSDGITGRGKIWKFGSAGGSGNDAGAEQLRVQPLRNSVALVGTNLFPSGSIPTDGVGRQIRSFAPGTLMDSATSAGDGIVANGIAFDTAGDLWIADSARGAIWRVQFNGDGSLKSPVGCDATFAANTLCLSNVFVAHPMLEAVDGIALDMAGNIWGVANGRQAIVAVSRADRSVRDVFRNPVNGMTGLRNAGDQSVGNDHVVEFPSSPYLLGDRFCTVSFDGTPPSSRDNTPPGAGEMDPAGAVRGKISCIDAKLSIPGLPLPVR